MISLAILEDLAGTAAFKRGEEYFSMGAVRRLQATNGKASAKVEGSEKYQVVLWDDDGELAYDCTFPRAADGYFCKHCVAVGLAWLADQAGEVKLKKNDGKAKVQRTGDARHVVKSFQMVIDDATYIHDFVDWREASTFASNIEQIVESLGGLLPTDTGSSLEQIDDSYGEVGIKSRDLSSG